MSGTFGTDDTIGKHWRHILNFFQSFVTGYNSGYIDYCNRNRCEFIEQELSEGIKEGEKALLQLNNQDLLNKELEVRGDYALTSSSSARELEFLISHTTHHYSVMRVILHQQGLNFSSDLGYAGSTT